MATARKQVQELARQFLRMSVVHGAISAERVGGVLAYIEKHRPPNALAVLRAYRRIVAAEIARGQAVIEHAGPITPAAVASIAAGMTQRYGRAVVGVAKRNDALLAGVRVRVGDDVYESSVAGQLATLAAAL